MGIGVAEPFGGDTELKYLIQWAAASRAKKQLNYFPWDEANIVSSLPRIAAKLRQKGWTVGQLADFLLRSLKPGSSFSQAEIAANNGKGIHELFPAGIVVFLPLSLCATFQEGKSSVRVFFCVVKYLCNQMGKRGLYFFDDR